MLLQHLTELAVRAHNWTSFFPERRGASLIAEFSAALQSDIDRIEKEGLKYGFTSEQLAATIAGYAAKYEKHFTAWLHAKSNCMSSMITGPARFPVRKAEKANNAERAKYQFFSDWRERCIRAIVRGFKPKETPLTELETAIADLESRRRNQELMKACNQILRKAKGADCTDKLIEAGLTAPVAREIQESTGKWWGKGYARFELSNNLANIKRLEQRVTMLSSKAERHSAGERKETELHGVRVVENFEADRLQLHFNGKPADEIREDLKRHGFRWSPSAGAWQRKLTNQACQATKYILDKHSELLK